MGKLSDLNWPFQSVQMQFTLSPSIPKTVINGPPERSRTRLPRPNAGAAWFSTAAFDEAEAEKAGANGILSASVTAIAIEACFVDANILNSILKLCSLQALGAPGCNKVRTHRCSSACVARVQARAWTKRIGERSK
jgi:hypothetical protein